MPLSYLFCLPVFCGIKDNDVSVRIRTKIVRIRTDNTLKKNNIFAKKADRKSFIRITRYIEDKIMNAKGKILIIDDNEDVLFALNLLLDPYVEKNKSYYSTDSY